MAKASPLSRSSLFQLLNFGRPRELTLPISVYGKLPIYKDFLRHGLAGEEAQAFKKWLDQGISKNWAIRERYREQDIGSFALLLSFPSTGYQILAYLWGSHDHGALRSFPFAVFVSLPSSRSLAPLERLDALGQLVAQGRALRRELEGLNGVEDFYPLIRTRTVQLTLHGDRQVQERYLNAEVPRVGELGTSLFGEEAGVRWPALLAWLKYPPKEEGRRQLAARLPSSALLASERLAGLWCLLASRRRKGPLQILWATDGKSGITILHRALTPKDVLALHPDMPGYSEIVDMRHAWPESKVRIRELDEERLSRSLSAILEKRFCLS